MRRLRAAAGLTQAELGDRTHVVSTRITQIERASGAKPTLELARALDAALGAEDLLVELWPYVYREAFPDWSRRFMEYAERAVAVRQYAAHVVPGLLQTEDYARAVLRVGRTLGSEEQLEERVTFRLPPLMSLDMIRSVREDNHRGAKVPSRSERRRLAQEQLQQSRGGRLRGGGRRVPRGRRPGP
ncbi:Scr1 family TA system antitoxin-like transcriptional regulator [Streptomyces sp. NPDC047880]|uniref:Scr1 family TA system antitoxin-like transcriptional regulator n=1 Tax=Streptomyces sp. NPDC047880 TaxID=3155626 RepID=UPI0034555C53